MVSIQLNCVLIYLLENDLLLPSQFGFRPLISIQEALVTVTNDWHQYSDCGKDAASIFFDLSKAFDVLPHSVILDALAKVGVHSPRSSCLQMTLNVFNLLALPETASYSSLTSTLYLYGVPHGN